MKTKIKKAAKYPLIGQWHFILSLSPAWWTHHSTIFQFGFFKLKEFPPEGEVFQKKHYKGFWLKWEFDLPEFGFTHNFKERCNVRFCFRESAGHVVISSGDKSTKIPYCDVHAVIAREVIEENYKDCIRCNGNGCPACDGTKGDPHNPEPY